MGRPSVVVRSRWQVKQWAIIERQIAYSVTCRLCQWSDTTSSRKEAEELFRNHIHRAHAG